jgi:hypothetical protein
MCSNCLDDDENCYACGGDVGELEEIWRRRHFL